MEAIFFIFSSLYQSIINISVYFSIGIGLATLIKVNGYDKYLQLLIAKRHHTSIPISVGTGSFTPLCSCGVIPVIAALLTAGVPLAPIMAFWITSPLMDPESFILTIGLLGMEMAIARLVATIFIGLTAGYLTLFFVKKGYLNNQILKLKTCGCETDKDTKNVISLSNKIRLYIRGFFSLSLFVGKFLILAFILEALIVLYIPMDWVPNVLGHSNPFGPVIAAFIGIPAYASSYASMPIVRSMIDLGMDKGTALSFMIAGAATSIPAMVAVYTLVKRKTFILYISYSLVGAIISGYIFRLFL
ncbi:permease [Liberiplasma polymorphum]|uniref:permease n=1 Tax=Liberiplasma polymorphum TaxID=3374570 RepID=UPI0037713CAC